MNLGPEIMKEVFESPQALRNELKLKTRKIHSVRYGIETGSFVCARVWNSLPSDLINVNPLSFSSQKSKIGSLKTALANFAKLTSNESATCKFPIKCFFYDWSI